MTSILVALRESFSVCVAKLNNSDPASDDVSHLEEFESVAGLLQLYFENAQIETQESIILAESEEEQIAKLEAELLKKKQLLLKYMKLIKTWEDNLCEDTAI